MKFRLSNQLGYSDVLTAEEFKRECYLSYEGEIINKGTHIEIDKVVDADYPLIVHHLRLEHTSQKLKALLPKEVLAP